MRSIFFILVGLFTLVCTFMKPRWYWEHRKARFLRSIVGDTITTIFYAIMGVMMIVLAIHIK